MSPEKSLCGSGSKLESCKEQLTGSGLRKKYDRAVDFHPVYAEHIMRNARVDELQAGIKISRKQTHGD